MNPSDLTTHYAAMKAGGYELEHPEFLKLKSWNGVLFQTASAFHSLKVLLTKEPTLGNLDDAYLEQALFSHFILQYSKCFTSSGKGQVSLDERRVFAGNIAGLSSHKRILELRNSLIAHNGNSELVVANIAVREDPDQYLVRHLLTIAFPKSELVDYEKALKVVIDYVHLRLNEHLDSLQDKLWKLVLCE